MKKLLILISTAVFSLLINSCTVNFTSVSGEVNIYVNVTGLDTESNSFIKAYLVYQTSNNSKKYRRLLLENNSRTKLAQVKNIDSNGAKYQFSFASDLNSQESSYTRVLTNINQICSSDNIGEKNTERRDVFINIDCKTQVKLEPLANLTQNKELNFPVGDFYLNKPVMKLTEKETNSNEFLKVNSKSFIYTSTNNEIAEIDKDGKIKFHKEGKVNFLLTPNPQFYTTSTSLALTVEAKKTNDLIVQSLDIGQSSLLPINSPYQVIAPKTKTLVRALIYTSPFKSLSPKSAKLTIEAADKSAQTKVDLKCPVYIPSRKIAKTDPENYDLEKSCYAILEATQVANLTHKAIFTFDFNFEGKTQTIKAIPNITQERKLKLKLVRGTNSIGAAKKVNEVKVKARIKQVFPFTQVEVSHREGFYSLSRETSERQGSLSKSLISLANLYRQEASESNNAKTHYYGLVPTSSCEGAVGLAYVAGPIAIGIADAFEPKSSSLANNRGNCGFENAITSTMMHELGHNFSLSHAPCGVNDGTDDFWKNSNAWENVEIAALSKAPLFVQETDTLRKANKTDRRTGYEHDLMGYCQSSRLTKHNYKKVAAYIDDHSYYNVSAPKVSPDFLNKSTNNNVAEKRESTYLRIITGEVFYDENKIIMEPISTTSNQLNSSFFQNSFDYWVKIKTKSKEIIYPLNILRLDHSSKMYFEVILPFDEPIESLSFFHSNNLIAHQIKATENLPEAMSRKEHRDFSLQKNQLIALKDGKLIWNAKKFPWLTCVLIEKDGSRTLITSNSTGGIFTLPKNLAKGKLEVILSDGLNNKIKDFEI